MVLVQLRDVIRARHVKPRSRSDKTARRNAWEGGSLARMIKTERAHSGQRGGTLDPSMDSVGGSEREGHSSRKMERVQDEEWLSCSRSCCSVQVSNVLMLSRVGSKITFPLDMPSPPSFLSVHSSRGARTIVLTTNYPFRVPPRRTPTTLSFFFSDNSPLHSITFHFIFHFTPRIIPFPLSFHKILP